MPAVGFVIPYAVRAAVVAAADQVISGANELCKNACPLRLQLSSNRHNLPLPILRQSLKTPEKRKTLWRMSPNTSKTPETKSTKTPRPSPFTSPSLSSLDPWKLFRSHRPSNESCVSSATPRHSQPAHTPTTPLIGNATSPFIGADSNSNQSPATPPFLAAKQLLQHRFTFPRPSTPKYRHQFSFDLPRDPGPWSIDMASDDGLGLGSLGLDGNRWSSESLGRTFPQGAIHIDGRDMVHSCDLLSMIELHMLACRNDRFVHCLQRNQQPRAELHAMKTMLEDRLNSAENNVLVARVSTFYFPFTAFAGVFGWS